MVSILKQNPGFFAIMALLPIPWFWVRFFYRDPVQVYPLTLPICGLLLVGIALMYESLLKNLVRKNLNRKLLICLILFCLPINSILAQGILGTAGILFLTAFIVLSRDTFYEEKGNLSYCMVCACPLALLYSELIPFLLIFNLILFQRHRENAYLLLTSWAIPVLFTRIHSFESGLGFFEVGFFSSVVLPIQQDFLSGLSQLFHAALIQSSHSELILLYLALLLVGLWSNQKGFLKDLNLSLLALFPIYFLIQHDDGTLGSAPLLFLAGLVLIQYFYQGLENLRSTNFSKLQTVLLLLFLFYFLYPFYCRAIGLTL